VTKVLSFALVLGWSFLPCSSIAATTCGGALASMQMTMGYVGTKGGPLHARSLEALAAIVDKDSHVQGWLAVDDRAAFWVQPKQGKDQLKLMNLQQNAPSVFVYVPGKLQLPPGYSAVACEALS
jgi:hypothetical protein